MTNRLRFPALLCLAALLASPASAYQWTFFNPSGDCGEPSSNAVAPTQWTSMTLTFVGQCKPITAIKPTKPVSLTKKLKFTAKGKGDCLLASVEATDTTGAKWNSGSWIMPALHLNGLSSGKIAVFCANRTLSRYSDPTPKL